MENAKIVQSTCYPNPFTDSFTLEIPESFGKQIKADLLNAQGQLVESRLLTEGENFWKPAQALPAGLYVLRLFVTDKTYVLRLVKR